MSNMPNRAKLAEIFQRVGKTQQEFADAMTKVSGDACSQQRVLSWLKRERVPAAWVPHIVKAGNGAIKAEELRPDLFGEL